MNNLIIYTERYKAVKQIASSDVVLKRIFTPKTGDIDSFIDSEIINEVFLDQKYENIFIITAGFGNFTCHCFRSIQAIKNPVSRD